ncbi:MAG: PD40 domain-containing protein [Acidobacteria bacterium]|nr:PD40 domain-containing protein [Acidobacteriota bacterium]
MKILFSVWFIASFVFSLWIPNGTVSSNTRLMPAKVESGNTVQLPRHPTLSPDGNTVAFSWRGDIWTVSTQGGTAFRLTAHPAYDSQPQWSPDGKWVAFASTRNGNTDVFVMSSQGGSPRQLTFYSGGDAPVGWTADSQAVLFTSVREYRNAGNIPSLYRIALSGGQPQRMLEEGAMEARLSPNGKQIAFTSGRVEWWRKRYRGTANFDLWTYIPGTKKYTQLTTHEGNDHWPLWSPDSGEIYYVSDEDQTFNLWMMSSTGAGKRKLTSFKDDGVRFPTISANGKMIAFESSTDLYVMETAGKSPRKLQIEAPTDDSENPTDRRVLTGQATEMAPSPDGEQVAFVVRGEIFVVKKDGGQAKAIASHATREQDLVWSADGKSLVFVSARDGNLELYSVTSDETEEKRLSWALKTKITRLTESPEPESNPAFSPDGKKLAFVRGRGDLYVADADGKNPVRLVEGWSTPQFSWSPDGEWIAYTKEDDEFNSEVFIIPAKGGTSVNVSMHPDNDFSPQWSADGRTLAFVSRRPRTDFEVYYLFLRKSDDEKSREELEDEEKKNAKPARPITLLPGQGAPKSQAERQQDPQDPSGQSDEFPKMPEKSAPVKVEIDFEDIHKRLRLLTTFPGTKSTFAIAPDSKTYVFTCDNQGSMDLYSIVRDGGTAQNITRGGQFPSSLKFTKDQKLFFLSQGGRINTVSIPPAPKPGGRQLPAGLTGGGGATPTPVAFQARVLLDRATLRREAFLEGWQNMNDGFYDPKFHGANWQACRQKYLTWAMAASCDEDYFDVFRMMLGELNSSHQGISPPFEGSDQAPLQTGALGVMWDEAYSGEGMRVARVIARSPASKSISRLNPGDVVLSINGEPVSMKTGVDQVLNDTVGQRTLLVVAKDNAQGEKRDVVIRPISMGEFGTLIYNDWVESRRVMVDKLSNGKLGYLHIRGMDQVSLDRFEQELYSEAHGKSGLVIDVRDNGGGSTADYLLTMINVRPHAYTTPRGSNGKGYPQDRLPFYFWTKPTTLLCNQFSYSNAEIFSHAFKATKRGKLIGKQTYGAVISTGAAPLIDGSTLRMPFRGWYVVGTNLNQELNGAMPDITVDVMPGDEAAGRDRQIERAVQELMTEVK